MTTTTDLPDVIIERYRLAELPPGEIARIDARRQRDAALRDRLAELDSSDAALQPDVERIAARISRQPMRRSRRAGWPMAAVALVGVLFVAVLLVRMRPPADGGSADDRIKGTPIAHTPALAVYRRTADGSERLRDGAVARAGDVIRLGYDAAGQRFGLIVSIDGRGTVTRHLPATGERATALDDARIVLLDQAYELDDAPMWERFYFVAGETPFAIEPVVQALQHGTAPPVGLTQSMLTIRKEGGR